MVGKTGEKRFLSGDNGFNPVKSVFIG
jgi:hypothetical protein